MTTYEPSIDDILSHCIERSHTPHWFETLHDVTVWACKIQKREVDADVTNEVARAMVRHGFHAKVMGNAKTHAKRACYYGAFWGVPYNPTRADLEFWETYDVGSKRPKERAK